jgi:putative transposase
MRWMGITTIYRMPRTSQWDPAHQIYPYLLRQLTITRPNHMWAADITDSPMKRGFVYLFGILDWSSRRVLA